MLWFQSSSYFDGRSIKNLYVQAHQEFEILGNKISQGNIFILQRESTKLKYMGSWMLPRMSKCLIYMKVPRICLHMFHMDLFIEKENI